MSRFREGDQVMCQGRSATIVRFRWRYQLYDLLFAGAKKLSLSHAEHELSTPEPTPIPARTVLDDADEIRRGERS